MNENAPESVDEGNPFVGSIMGVAVVHNYVEALCTGDRDKCVLKEF